jgi:hypothetical protein
VQLDQGPPQNPLLNLGACQQFARSGKIMGAEANGLRIGVIACAPYRESAAYLLEDPFPRHG